jgi:anti-anti-sigma factor
MTPLKTDTDLVPSARKEGDTVIASIYGEIDLHNSPEVRRALLMLLQQNNPNKLVLNLTQVPYMDSSAVAVLVETLQKMRKIGGKVCLTNLQPRVQGLLEIARLGSIFVITKTEEEAIQP